MAELVFLRRGEELMRVTLDSSKPETVVGRGSEVDVSVPDDKVSRRQVAIVQRGAKYFALNRSEHGTHIDGEKVSAEVELKDGSEISLGALRAVFHAASSGPSTQTEANDRVDLTRRMQLTSRAPVGTLRVRIRVNGEETQREFPGKDEIAIGKDEQGNDLVIDDRFVSSYHARIARTQSGFWLRDLGSTNGTFINGARVREIEVGPGSTVRVGETELILELVGAKGDGDGSFEGMVGKDAAMTQLFDLIERVAPSSASVAVFGETGTGKELVARAIHARSSRRDRPFVPVNCSAIARELIESELFGHEKGAFTGADRQRVGAFEEASGGTIFLDEIGELPIDLQSKLLRTLENGEIKRVGATRPVQVDVRVVAATHRDLLSRARKGEFREDLYYRLCVFPLTLPPLRRRPSDLKLLTDFFVQRFASLPLKLTEAARHKLSSHPFPGNIRELRNVVQRAILLRNGAEIDAAHIMFDQPSSPEPEAGASRAGEGGEDDSHLYLPGRTFEVLRQEIFARALRRHGGNKTHAAEELGIKRSTITANLPGAADEGD